MSGMSPKRIPTNKKAEMKIKVTVVPQIEWTHESPHGDSGLTPCCGRSPHDLPTWHRMTKDPLFVTCPVLLRNGDA